MNKDESKNKDLLSQFMNNELSEKAPSGFTSKVMSRVRLEPNALHSLPHRRRLSPVPVISLGIAVLLILSAVLLTTGNNTYPLPISDFLKNIQIAIPAPAWPDFSFIKVPGWFPYVIAGLFLLSLFDRVLYGFFRKWEK